MDSFLNWVGGKSQSASKIVDIMPEHGCYCEIFAGACIHPDTRIDMYNGLLKLASEVHVGDLVLTHKGNYKEVTKVFTRDYEGDIYVINGLHTFRRLMITPEHPVLIMKRKSNCAAHLLRATYYHKRCPYKHPKCKSYKVLKYTEPKNIEKGDYLVYPIHKAYDNVIRTREETNKNQMTIFECLRITKEKKNIPDTSIDKVNECHPYFLNDDFLEMCGFYIAEGSPDSKRRIAFTFNSNEKEYISLVKDVMQKYFKCSYDEDVKENTCQIRFFSVDAYRFLTFFFGHGARNKYIHRSVMELPVNKLKVLLRTYIFGDGCFGHSKSNEKDAPFISIKSVSCDLMNQLKVIFNRLGIISNLQYNTKEEVNRMNAKYSGEDYVISNSITSNYGIYILTINGGFQCNKLNELIDLNYEFTKVEGSTHGEIDSEYVYIPVHSIEKTKYKGKVYNFEVDDDNSYVANGFCVHNCWTLFRKQPSKDEVINDVNSELINLYRTIQRNCEEFKKRAKYELYARDLYYEYLQDFYSGKHHTLSSTERAFRFFYLIKGAFASKFGAGFAFGSNRQSPVSFFNEFKILDDITKRLKNVTIDNRDFEDIIRSYDSERTLIFADPPYMKADNADYYFKSADAAFGIHDHQRLFVALKSIKGKCILTVDNTPWVRERYTKENGFFTLENTVYYCSADADNRRHEIELIITNYDTANIRKHTNINQAKLEF